MLIRYSYVYIITNFTNTTLYTGICSNLVHRIWQHKYGTGSEFSSKYKLTKLVYYEIFEDIKEAIRREKQIKGGSRSKKINLINKFNPEWKDLYNEIV